MPISMKHASVSLRCVALSLCLMSHARAADTEAGAVACPTTAQWANAARFTATASEPATSVVLERFSDGAYFAITDAGKQKTMFSLKAGMQAVRGDADTRPQEFFRVEKLVGGALSYIVSQFPEPCLIEEGRELVLDVRKGEKPGGSDWDFSGWVRRNGAVIAYGVKPRGSSGPGMALAGSWEYAPQLRPIPDNTSLVGWQAFHPDGTPLNSAINDAIDSVGALRARFPAGERRL